jgi:hypothetical protein
LSIFFDTVLSLRSPERHRKLIEEAENYMDEKHTPIKELPKPLD